MKNCPHEPEFTIDPPAGGVGTATAPSLVRYFAGFQACSAVAGYRSNIASMPALPPSPATNWGPWRYGVWLRLSSASGTDRIAGSIWNDSCSATFCNCSRGVIVATYACWVRTASPSTPTRNASCCSLSTPSPIDSFRSKSWSSSAWVSSCTTTSRRYGVSWSPRTSRTLLAGS